MTIIKRFLEWIKIKSRLDQQEHTPPLFKEGTWYFTFIHNQKSQTAVLSQTRVISYKRLKELFGKVDSVDYKNIKKAFMDLHK